MAFITLFYISNWHSVDKTSFLLTHFVVNTVFLGLQKEKAKFYKCPDMWPNMPRCLKASCPVSSCLCFCLSKPISTYSVYVSVSILAIYFFSIKMLILNSWVTIFQMVIPIFFKVMTMEACGFSCAFVKNSFDRVSCSDVFSKWQSCLKEDLST